MTKFWLQLNLFCFLNVMDIAVVSMAGWLFLCWLAVFMLAGCFYAL
jgi:hypothetical protein